MGSMEIMKEPSLSPLFSHLSPLRSEWPLFPWLGKEFNCINKIVTVRTVRAKPNFRFAKVIFSPVNTGWLISRDIWETINFIFVDAENWWLFADRWMLLAIFFGRINRVFADRYSSPAFSFKSLEPLKWLNHESPISRKEGWGFYFIWACGKNGKIRPWWIRGVIRPFVQEWNV